MRCSRKSTTWRGSTRAGLPVLLVLASCALAAAPADRSGDDAVRAAIVRAVQTRFGEGSVATVDGLTVRTSGPLEEATLVATPDPAARLGRVVRFSLRWRDATGRQQSGEAQCLLDAHVPHVRATRLIARGDVIAAGDVALVVASPGAVPLRRLPTDVAGAKALRDLYVDAPVLPSAVVLAPAVRSGDDVALTVLAPGLSVETRGVAAEDGHVGELVRVVNRESGKHLKGRVVARGQVEVTHGS